MKANENICPPAARPAEGRAAAVEATGNRSFADQVGTGKTSSDGWNGWERPSSISTARGRPEAHRAAFRAPTGRVWHYSGKRARVLVLLATRPEGVTQWDTLPWHTRLGGTIHALRDDGLAIDTQREGEFRHARYRLRTPGTLDDGVEA